MPPASLADQVSEAVTEHALPSEADTATERVTTDRPAHSDSLQPSSQLLEDTPMELWEFDASAAPELHATDTAVTPFQPSGSSCAEALRELEDFCKRRCFG